jgi:hypothetical protein
VWIPAAAAPPPSIASTLATVGGRRRAKLVRLTAAAGLSLLARPGTAGASPPSAPRSPAGAARRPRTPCSSGGAGHRSGGPGTLDGWAAAGAARLRAPRRRRSISPTSVDEGMTPRSSIFAYPVPAKEEACSKDIQSPQGPARQLGVEVKKPLVNPNWLHI